MAKLSIFTLHFSLIETVVVSIKHHPNLCGKKEEEYFEMK